MGYVVALRYTSKAGGYAGVVTSTDFGSKAEFDAWFLTQDKHEVVEEGITLDRAVQLADATPVKCLLMSAVEEYCESRTGELISGDLLIGKIEQILLMLRMKQAA
jgi:hypothetical protein